MMIDVNGNEVFLGDSVLILCPNFAKIRFNTTYVTGVIHNILENSGNHYMIIKFKNDDLYGRNLASFHSGQIEKLPTGKAQKEYLMLRMLELQW